MILEENRVTLALLIGLLNWTNYRVVPEESVEADAMVKDWFSKRR